MDEKEMQKGLRKILIFTICVGIGLVVAGLGFLQIFLEAFHEETHERVEEEAVSYGKRIEKQVSQNFQMLNTFASVIGDASLYDSDMVVDVLTEACEEIFFVSMGFFDLDEQGIIAVENQATDRNVSLADIQKEGQEIVNLALTGEAAVSGIFVGAYSHEQIFMFGVPVYNRDQEITGALIASDLVEAFSEIVDGEKIMDGNAYIHLIHSDGQFIIRSSHTAVEEEKPTIFEEPYLRGEDLERVKTQMQQGEKTLFEFRHDGMSYHALLEPVGLNNWYVLCINSIQNSNQRIYKISQLFLAFFVLMVLLVIYILSQGYRIMRRTNQKLMDLAYLDPLTGIYNLHRFRELVRERIEQHPDYAIAILNVRKFKFVNEIFGKEQADRLLVFIANVLQNGIHEHEYVCRDSADSFYICMDGTDRDQIEARLLDMIEEIVHAPNPLKNDEYRLKVHCGVAVSGDDTSIQKIMTRAMFALVKAKENYQESIWFFDFQLHENEKMDNYVERHMHEALEKENFRLYLQPKINLKDHALSGAEALVRWIEDDGKMIFPNQFIPLFEENGFCAQLDLYMVRKVCRLLREWMDAGYTPIPVSINQSKLVFYENRYIEKLCAILDEYRIPADLITLEILEEMAIENIEELNEKLNDLRKIGFKISMDDFGSGYSSLNILGKISIDELKLDRGFLMDINDSKNGNAYLILEEIVQLSKKMSVITVVEGVETAEDDALVERVGCDYGQGYYYSRPVSAEDFTKKFIVIV